MSNDDLLLAKSSSYIYRKVQLNIKFNKITASITNNK